MKRAIVWSAVSLVLLVLLACSGMAVPFIVIFELIAGWGFYLARVIPRVHVNPMGVASAVACLAGTFVLAHVIARWLWDESRRGRADVGPHWRVRWTVALVSLVVLTFVSGIGATGIAHQIGWLARSEQRLVTHTSIVANRVKCGSNLRQIGQAMALYVNDSGGAYPQRLEDLLLTQDLTVDVFVCPATDDQRAPGATPHEQAAHLHDGRHCSYVYHGRGLVVPLPEDLPIACEPTTNHAGAGMNVLFVTGHVEWLTLEEAKQVLSRIGRP